MNTLLIVILSVLTIYLAYNFYAKRIDRNLIQPDAKRATPARMYMDGVDFMPTSRNVLFGYHFKAIAAAGPIVGPITAANLWGWGPSVATRFIQWFKDFGIPVGGVLVNMVIDPASVGPNSAEFVKNRVAMRQEHMRTIWREFDGSVRAVVPLFETEVRGLPMLQRLCDAIFAADGAKPAPVAGPAARSRS